MRTVMSTIKNGFVYLPEKPCGTSWPRSQTGNNDDQADSTSQALDWMKSLLSSPR